MDDRWFRFGHSKAFASKFTLLKSVSSSAPVEPSTLKPSPKSYNILPGITVSKSITETAFPVSACKIVETCEPGAFVNCYLYDKTGYEVAPVEPTVLRAPIDNERYIVEKRPEL